jgi:uncharacterized protein YbjT (DUF2867 family)
LTVPGVLITLEGVQKGAFAMILVVGGTGTLGKRLVPRLVERDERVRVLVRHTNASMPEAVEQVLGDISDTEGVKRAVAGASTVVCAVSGFGGIGGANPRAVDGLGTRALIAAAAEAGVERFVFVSVFHARADHPNELQREKFQSEQALRASGIPWTILRPAPSMERWIWIVGENVPAGGKALVLGKGENPVNFVSAEDVASVVVDAATGASPPGRVIDVAGPEDVTLLGIVDAFSAALGRPVPIRKVPPAALRAMSLLARPFAPARAWQARATAVMDSTDMAIRAQPPDGVTGQRTLIEVIGFSLQAAGDVPLPEP